MFNQQLADALAGFRAGDQNRYYDIYNLTAGYIYGLIYNITKDADTANYILGQVYGYIVNNIGTLVRLEDFYPWASDVTTGITLDYLLQYNPGALTYESRGDEDVSQIFLPDYARADNQAFISERFLVEAEKQRVVNEYIASLSVVEQIVLQMYYYENQTIQNISYRLQRPENEIRYMLAVVKSNLIKLIGDEDGKNEALYDMASIPVLYYLFESAVTGTPVSVMATSATGAVGAAAGTAGAAVGAGVSAGAAVTETAVGSGISAGVATGTVGVGAAAVTETAVGSGISAGVAMGTTGASAASAAGAASAGIALGAKVAIGIGVLAVVGGGAVLTRNIVSNSSKDTEVTSEVSTDITVVDSEEAVGEAAEETTMEASEETTMETTEQTTEEVTEADASGYSDAELAAVDDYFEMMKADILATAQWPDGDVIDITDTSELTFWYYDVDLDGLPEMWVTNDVTSMAGMETRIFGYNPRTQTMVEEAHIFPAFTVFDNGLIAAHSSHNQTFGEYWPTSFLVYDAEKDEYTMAGGAFIYGFNKEYIDYEGYSGEPFPDDVDLDGNGAVYNITWYDENGEVSSSEWVDDDEMEACEQKYEQGAAIVDIGEM